jgi:hypothetical protein
VTTFYAEADGVFASATAPAVGSGRGREQFDWAESAWPQASTGESPFGDEAPQPEQSPALAEGPADADRPLLRQGSRGEAVTRAQLLLNRFLAVMAVGPGDCVDLSPRRVNEMITLLSTLRRNGQLPLVVDGRFGPSTEHATRLFQSCLGLARDGMIGPVTWHYLQRNQTPEPAPTPTCGVPERPPTELEHEHDLQHDTLNEATTSIAVNARLSLFQDAAEPSHRNHFQYQATRVARMVGTLANPRTDRCQPRRVGPTQYNTGADIINAITAAHTCMGQRLTAVHIIGHAGSKAVYGSPAWSDGLFVTVSTASRATGARSITDVPVSALANNVVVVLHGCNQGHGPDSFAEQLYRHLAASLTAPTVFAHPNSGCAGRDNSWQQFDATTPGGRAVASIAPHYSGDGSCTPRPQHEAVDREAKPLSEWAVTPQTTGHRRCPCMSCETSTADRVEMAAVDETLEPPSLEFDTSAQYDGISVAEHDSNFESWSDTESWGEALLADDSVGRSSEVESENLATLTKQASTLVVNPFPIAASLPLKMDDTGLIACEDAASRGADVTHLCGAVVDLTGDPALPSFASHNPTDMLYVGSLAKIYVMYVAFELKNRVERRAKAMIAAGLSTSSPGWQGQVYAKLKTEWQPELNAAFPRLPRGFPKLSDIVALSATGDASFTENTPPLTDAELDAIGEFGAPRGRFRDWMRLMMRWSNNAAASRCILALSYPYLNGVLGSVGFFERTSKTGLWISGDYMGHDWLPNNGAGQKLTPRWATLQQRRTTNFAGTAFQVARLVTLLGQGKLVNAASSADMLSITTGADGIGSYIQSALARAPRAFLRVFSKIGFGNDNVSHDCAFVRVNDGGGDPARAIKYVVVVLGSPPANGRRDFDKLTVAYHDCIVSRHP